MRRCNTEYDFTDKIQQISACDVYNNKEVVNLLPLLICQICLNILNSQVQCEKCNQCFCHSCILRNNYSCLYRCSQPNFKNNVFVNNVLSILKFKCKNGCNKIIGYNDLGKHYDEDCDAIDFKKKYKDLKKSILKSKKSL